MAAALAMFLLGLSPALAMDRVAPDRLAPDPIAPDSGLDARWTPAAGRCPTRFDYLVLASLADAPGLLSLSTYRFRSKVGFSTLPLAVLIRVDYRIESSTGDCRYHGVSRGESG